MQRALLRSNIIKRLLKKSKKDLKSYYAKYKINRAEDCIIEVNQRNKKYCCFFNESYMLFTYAGKNYKPVENKELEKQLKNILNGGCSKSRYIHEVNLQRLRQCADKYKEDGETLYSFKFNFGKEEMFLNPVFLYDCLGFVGTRVIYFNSRFSPVVFKNSGEELKDFGILFPIKKNS